MYDISYFYNKERNVKMTKYTIHTLDDYDEWIETQTLKSRRQILKRLEKNTEGHFGHINDLDEDGDGLQELKFK